MQWAGQLNGTQTALYVRSCGQVESGTEGCDHTAGVCGVVVSIFFLLLWWGSVLYLHYVRLSDLGQRILGQ